MNRLLLSLLVLSISLSATTINVPADQATIQAGIDVAVNGDTVLVGPGTFNENLILQDKMLTLASLYATTGDTSYISNTIIDGNLLGATCKVDGVLSSLTMIGLTITRGAPNETNAGSGLLVLSAHSVHVINSRIRGNNSGWPGGGGLLISNTDSVKIENAWIYDNTNDMQAGGIMVWNGVQDFELVNSILAYNTIHAMTIEGTTSSKVINSTFYNNEGSDINLHPSNVDSTLVLNSIFVKDPEVPIWTYFIDEGGTCVFYNNFVTTNTTDFLTRFGRYGDNIFSTEDPFVNSGSDNFELNNYSDALGTGRSSILFNGATVFAPVTDFSGQTRPNQQAQILIWGHMSIHEVEYLSQYLIDFQQFKPELMLQLMEILFLYSRALMLKTSISMVRTL